MDSLRRIANIDFYKGILMVLVIIGHILPGTLEENYVRYIIYAVHMPLFFMISGYLFDVDKKILLSLTTLIKNYWKRLLLPWIIAVNVYYFATSVFAETELSIFGYIRQWVAPYYHLWYVPSYLFCIFWTVMIYKLLSRKFSINVSKSVIFLFSFVVLLVTVFPPILHKGVLGLLMKFISHTIKPQFVFFFVLGGILRKFYKKNIKSMLLASLFLEGFVIVSIGFYFQNNVWVIFAKYIFSVIIMLLFCNIEDVKIPNNLFVVFGRNSLGFYLWHVLGKILALAITNSKYTATYYIVNLLWILVLGITIYKFRNNKIAQKYFLGIS